MRVHHPYAAYDALPITAAIRDKGDVYARWRLRSVEIEVSHDLIRKAINSMTPGPVSVPCHAKSGHGVGAVESWRGEIVTVVRFRDGVIDRAVVRDPSFVNWALFGEIGPGNIVPDFPLCNKSLNLSYSGTDM